jgi:hypothetical protein
MQDPRVTRTDFRLCSTCPSHSQAGICSYARPVVSVHGEPTIARVRYSLGSFRPRKTTPLPGSPRKGEPQGDRRVVFQGRCHSHVSYTPSTKGQW